MSAYDDIVLARASLKHYYKLSEASGSTIFDSKGAVDGTIVGGVTLGSAGIFTANDSQTVATFNGSSGYIRFATKWGADANWTYECQFFQTADTGGTGDGGDPNCLMQNGNGEGFSNFSGSGHAHQISGGEAGDPSKANLQVKNLTGSGALYESTSAFAFSVARHLMITFDGTSLRFYINGALDRLVAAVPGTVADTSTVTVRALIGACMGGFNGTSPSGFFTGKIAKVAYYNAALSADDALASYNAAITVPPTPATPTTPYYDVRMYGPDNLRRALSKGGCDAELVNGVNFEYLERGGYGQGSVEMLGTWENLQLAGDEHFDVYLLNELAYRGYVRVPENSIESSERCRVTMYGLMEMANQWQVTRKYAYGCPADLSTVFEEIVADFVDVTGRQAGIEIDTDDTGVLVSTFDGRGKTVAAALNELCDIAPGQVIWGFDTDSSGNNRIYLRVKETDVAYRFIIGKDVEGFVYPRDQSAIVNRLFITGGKAEQPNLLTNGDFSDVAPSSDVVNNLILNYSFEDTLTGTLNAGATIKDPTLGATAHGAARTGSHWLELDTTGENWVSDPLKMDWQKVYVASLWTRWEDAVASSGDLVTMSVQGYDVSNNPVLLAVVTSPSLNPGGDIYKNYTLSVDFTAFSNVTSVKITITGSGGSASNDGILVDDVGFWEHCSIGQVGWRLNLDGAATVQELDWAAKTNPVPFRGGYCMKLNASGIVNHTTDTLTIYTPKSNYTSVKPNERYTILLRWWAPGPSLGVISLGAVPIKTDGTQDTLQESAQISAIHTGWTLQTFAIRTASDTASLELFFRCRDNFPIYVSAVMLVEGGEPPGVTDDDDYWSGENYELVIDVEDSDLAGLLDTLECDAEDSITDNGEHELAITNDNVYNRDTALALAKDYFKSKGCPKVQASLTVRGPSALMRQAGTVVLLNLPDPPPALFPTRIQYKVDGAGGIVMTADLGNDRPELATLLGLPARVV